MELVYLWIDEYKNIINEGFNFSPRFTCSYDKDTNELTIEENEYVSVFPENINITAIVGENGSGKTHILDRLLTINKPDRVVYLKDNTFFLPEHMIVKMSSKKYRCELLDYRIPTKHLNTDVTKKSEFSKAFTAGHNEYALLSGKYYNKLNFDTYEQNINIKIFIMYKVFNLHNQYFFQFNPRDVYISIDHDVDLRFDVNSSVNEFANKFPEMFDVINEMQNLRLPASIDIINPDIRKQNDLKTLHKTPFKTLSGEIEEIFSNLELFHEANKIPMDEKFEFSELQLKPNELEAFIILARIGYYKIRIFDDKGRTVNALSQGERKSYIESLFFAEFIEQYDECIICLDEPDLTNHPELQKKYINSLVKLFDTKDKEFHLILTTHSPFLLSDLPKDNIIFLKKDKKTGNCINVTKETDINPFGANIHTLLSHGFFMEDGLMGEFAKGKIEEAIKYLNQVKLSDEEIAYCEKIIYIIGEPIIKRQLQKMLDSKRLSKVDLIEKQIKDLQDELEKIKND